MASYWGLSALIKRGVPFPISLILGVDPVIAILCNDGNKPD